MREKEAQVCTHLGKDSKLIYESPRVDEITQISGLNLLAGLSLEGDFEEDLIDGGDAEYLDVFEL